MIWTQVLTIASPTLYTTELSHSALLTELSRYPIMLYHWAIPLSHNALLTELSRYPIMLYSLSYPIMLYSLSYPTIP